MSNTWKLKALVTLTLLMANVLFAWAQGDELLVTAVSAMQFPGPGMVIVTYGLETVDDLPVTVTLHLSTDGGLSYTHLCQWVSGDVGTNVPPGASKYIVWNAGADIRGFSGANCRLRVTADDRQPEIPDGFVAIAPGTFRMGSPTTELSRESNEILHQVTLTRGIYVHTTEVTNQQYRDLAQWAYDLGYVTATSASLCDNLDGSTEELLDLDGLCEISFSGGMFTVDAGKANHPVLDVTWYGAVAYCDWLSLQQSLPRAYNHSTWQCNAGSPYSATGYRLPTEAEWEYACRAGTQSPFNTGSCLAAGTEANYNGNWPYTGCPTGPFVGWTAPVGSYLANAFGLSDMHGSLWEWCNDWYGAYGGTVTEPVGADAGSLRVFRGGDWSSSGARYCRSAYRGDGVPNLSNSDVGFRPVRSTF